MSAPRVGVGWSTPFLVAVIWGVNVPVMKAAVGVIHPFAFNALRLTFSVVALGMAARWIRGQHGVRASGPNASAPSGGEPRHGGVRLRDILLLTMLTSLGYQALFITGMARTSAGHTGFLIASGPLWTALLARAAGIERVSRGAWTGLVLAFVGTVLVVAVARGGEATLLGNGLVLLAMLSWAWGTVRSRPVLARIPATRLAFLTGLYALPGHWLLALPHLDAVWGQLSLRWTAAILYSGVLSTGLAYALWNQSVRALGPSRTSAYTNLVPLVALALAWAMLGERPGLVQVVGGLLVLVGIGSWRAARSSAPDRAGR